MSSENSKRPYHWHDDAYLVQRRREEQKRADARAAMRAAELARQTPPAPLVSPWFGALLTVVGIVCAITAVAFGLELHREANSGYEEYQQADSEYFAGLSAAQDAYWDCQKRSRHDLPRDCDDLREAWKTYHVTHPRPTYPSN